jgi:hypothetical protein
VVLFFTIFRDFVMKVLSMIFPGMIRVGELQVDENLDNYFRALDDHDREWSIKEEENARKNLGLKTLDDETLHKLKTSRMGKDHLEGVHSYDILANPLYLDDFQYFSPYIENREKYIIDDDEDEENDMAQSDLVKMVLSLAFMTEERASNFTFDKNAYQAHIKGMLGNMMKHFSHNK